MLKLTDSMVVIISAYICCVTSTVCSGVINGRLFG